MTSVIKVDTIQNSSGTSALSIDGSGNVSAAGALNSRGLSYIPHFRATRTGTGTGAQNPITWLTTITNIGSHFDGTYFTAPVDGVYLFSYQLLNQNNGNNSAGFKLNGTDLTNYNNYVQFYDISMSGTVSVLMSAEDTMSVRCNNDVYDQYSHFSGVLIG